MAARYPALSLIKALKLQLLVTAAMNCNVDILQYHPVGPDSILTWLSELELSLCLIN
jgi:hypothetical protein